MFERSGAKIQKGTGTRLACLLASGIAASFAFAGPVAAQDDGPITYTMASGDTLYALAQDYFVSEEAALRVQSLNQIANARRIPVGTVISVPRSLLKWDPVTLQVVFFSGDVTIEQRGRIAVPSQRQSIGRNAIVSTGARSFISLRGEGTTALSLPSNSRVQIRRARRYRINNILDVDLRVLQGRGEIRAPKLRDQERFRTGTPIAVTAVRGTEFRVAYDEESGLALTEVTEGLVDISADGSAIAAAAGKGVASNLGGLGTLEDLLAAPVIGDRSATQTGEELEFTVTPIEGAVAYRTQIARDVTFTDVINEQVSSDLSITFAEVPDGRYSVRTRAVAESGLEGFWQGEDASFRRKQVGSSVQAEPAPFADAYKFAWLPTGTGPSYAAFQMWKKDAPENLLFDEVGLDAPGIYISDLEPGVYTWRVATSVIDEGEVLKVWSEARDLTVSE